MLHELSPRDSSLHDLSSQCFGCKVEAHLEFKQSTKTYTLLRRSFKSEGV